MNGDLPQGWATVRIADIATTQSGGTPSTAKREYWEGGDVPWINSGALKDTVISSPSTFITKLGLENSSARMFPRKTVVIALTGATTGRVGLLELATSTNQSVTGIFPSLAFVSEYLFYFLRSARDAVLEQEIGSAQPHINKQIVDELQVPLAPLAEQQRIVAKLELLLGQVEACQQRLDKIPTLLKRFRQSVLAAACSGHLTADWRSHEPISTQTIESSQEILIQRLDFCESKEEREKYGRIFDDLHIDEIIDENGWLSLKAELVCDFITKGTTPKTSELKPIGDVPYIKVYNIADNKIDFKSKPQYISKEIHQTVLKRSIVYPNDVLMNIVGPPLGKVAIVPDQFPEWNINQALAIFRPIKAVMPEFLYVSLLGSKSLRKIITETRGIVGQSNISLEQCRALDVNVPPLDEQQEIVRRVECLFALADNIEQRYKKAQAFIDKLTPSLLAKAFRGELVPQDPNDEPASVLLGRIQKEKTDKPNKRGNHE